MFKSLKLKNPITGLNKIFESRIRLGVMSILIVNPEVNFNDLKQMRGKVSIGYLQHLFQVIKIYFRIHYQDTHNPQANAALKNFI